MTDNQQQDFVYSLAASPNFAQDGICFAARQSGLYRSEDGGQSWTFAYDSLDLQATLVTLTVAVSPNFESDRNVFAGVPGGVVRSIDGGLSWEPIILPAPPPPQVSTLAISPNYARDSIVLAATVEDGVFRSADEGRHWSAWNFGLLDLNTLCLAISPGFASDNTLYVGTDTGLYRSKNGGLAWREVNFPPEFAPVLSLALSPNFAEDNVLFAGTESNGLFTSADRGQSWTRLAEAKLPDTVNGIILAPQFPAKPDSLILSESLLISRDGGQNWSDWPVESSPETGIASVLAPQGLDEGGPLLLGLYDGRVLRV